MRDTGKEKYIKRNKEETLRSEIMLGRGNRQKYKEKGIK
jgi:hypothetical protein